MFYQLSVSLIKRKFGKPKRSAHGAPIVSSIAPLRRRSRPRPRGDVSTLAPRRVAAVYRAHVVVSRVATARPPRHCLSSRRSSPPCCRHRRSSYQLSSRSASTPPASAHVLVVMVATHTRYAAPVVTVTSVGAGAVAALSPAAARPVAPAALRAAASRSAVVAAIPPAASPAEVPAVVPTAAVAAALLPAVAPAVVHE